MKSLSGVVVILMTAGLAALTPRAGAEPLLTNFGLGNIFYPLEEPQSVRYPSWYEARSCRFCKEHVYIFGVNGWNPLCLGNFNGLCGYLKKQGFEHTHFGQLYSSRWFARRIREIRHADPEARIVLIGFSLGANYIQGLANDLARQNVRVDLLVYLVGDFLTNTRESYPANVGRVVNVRAQGLLVTGGDLFFNGANIDGARNEYFKFKHMAVPSRRETLELVLEELLALCCVPYGQPHGEPTRARLWPPLAHPPVSRLK